MITTPTRGTDQAPPRSFASLADEASVQRTAAALEAHGMTVIRADDAEEARRIVLDLLPEGAQVHHGASQTLDVTGITAELEASGRFEPVGLRIRSLDRATQGDEIRRLAAAPEVMLGSVHAVTESGSLLTASYSGSQLGPYASGAGRVILVVGTQKIVPDLESGLRRIDEHAYPLEDARALKAYGMHSDVSKILIIHREFVPGRISVVLVDQALGY